MKVSVIVPSYNQAQFLEQTLRSILSQEGELEVIVQDGGSTDGSVEILKRMLESSQKYDAATSGALCVYIPPRLRG